MDIPNPIIRQLEYRDELYELYPYLYKAVLSNGKVLRIKDKYIFDGASIPRVLWSLIGSPFEFSYSICHDILYQAELMTRAEADWEFILILKLKGVGWVKRNAMWLGLRAGGWVTWNKHTPESIAEARAFGTLESR